MEGRPAEFPIPQRGTRAGGSRRGGAGTAACGRTRLPAARRRADGAHRECPAGLAPGSPPVTTEFWQEEGAQRPLVSRVTWKPSVKHYARTHAREEKERGLATGLLAAAQCPREGRNFTHLWYSRSSPSSLKPSL